MISSVSSKSKLMNVVLFSSDYLPNIGGVATHVHELAQALDRLGHRVCVVTVRNARWLDPRTWFHHWVERDGIRTLEVSLAGLPTGHGRYWRLRKSVGRLLNHWKTNDQPVILHVHDCDYGQYIASQAFPG